MPCSDFVDYLPKSGSGNGNLAMSKPGEMQNLSKILKGYLQRHLDVIRK